MTGWTFLKRWWPVLAWMTLIFIGSTDVLAVNHTSRFLGPFVRWLIPGISDEHFGQIQLLVRKTGHFVEYAVLAALCWRALNGSQLGQVRPWPAKLAFLSWLIASLYAVTDEFHQSFVDSRQGQVMDGLIDAAGAAAAVVLIGGWGRIRRRWQVADDAPGIAAAERKRPAGTATTDIGVAKD